jgi:hypothetical protein
LGRLKTRKMAKGLRQLLETLLVREGYTREERLEILDHSNYPFIRDNLLELLCLLLRRAKEQGSPLTDHILMEISIAAGHVSPSSPSLLESDSSPYYSASSTASVSDKLPLSRAKIVLIGKQTKTGSQCVSTKTTSTQTRSKSVSDIFDELESCFAAETVTESSESEESEYSPRNSNGKAITNASQMVLRSNKCVGHYSLEKEKICVSDSDESNDILTGLPVGKHGSDIYTTENEKLDREHSFPPKTVFNPTGKKIQQKDSDKDKKLKGQKLEQCVSRAHLLRSCRVTSIAEGTESSDLRARGEDRAEPQPSTSGTSCRVRSIAEGTESSDLRARGKDRTEPQPSTAGTSKDTYDPGPSTSGASREGRKRSRKAEVPHKKVKK